MDRIAWLIVATLGALLAGCLREQQSADSAAPDRSSAEPRPSVALLVVVVNEPQLAEAIGRLRGEWNERSGGELDVFAKPWPEVIAQKALDADLIVFPSRYLGELGARDWLRPVRQNVLESDDLRSADFFPLVRHELIDWDGRVMALPLGVDLPEINGRTDVLPAISLLAQAALDAISKDRLGVLFDSETMKPRIAEPPFVDALTRITQPNQNVAPDRSTNAAPVPVLGYSDRLVGVATSSRNAASAFMLLEWLALPDISSQLARSGDVMPVRRSLASSPAWYGASLSAAERTERSQALEAALSRSECLMIPRIPGVDEYMAALDEAVLNALHGGVAPRVALEKAAQRWDEITEARGRDDQRQAYLKHLGIGEP